MGRNKKILTPDEQLKKVNANIESEKEKLKKLKILKKELEEKIRVNKLEELGNLISTSDKSYEDVKEFLSGKS